MINMYEVYEAEYRELCHLAYINSPNFNNIEKEANRQGFRKALLTEINASALSHPTAVELFCWRGVCGLKLNNPLDTSCNNL